MKRILSFLSVLLFSIFTAFICGLFLNVDPLIGAAISFTGSFIPLPGGSIYSLLFTAPGGAGVAFSQTTKQLPQFLMWNNVVALTSLRIESQEDGVLMDLSAAAIAAINGYMILGGIPANMVILRLADGKINNRNVTISGVTSGAGAIDFFINSDKMSKFNTPFKLSNASIIAGDETIFTNFTALFMPTLAHGDTCEITYQSGLVTVYDEIELANLSSLWQSVAAIMVNNVNAYIKQVKVVAAADTPAYQLSVKLS